MFGTREFGNDPNGFNRNQQGFNFTSRQNNVYNNNNTNNNNDLFQQQFINRNRNDFLSNYHSQSQQQNQNQNQIFRQNRDPLNDDSYSTTSSNSGESPAVAFVGESRVIRDRDYENRTAAEGTGPTGTTTTTTADLNSQLRFFRQFPDLTYLLTGAGGAEEKADQMPKSYLHVNKVSYIAFTSRFIILFLQVLAPSILPIHKNDGFRAQLEEKNKTKMLDGVFNEVFSGFANWDGQYFLHISLNGYTHENTIAFFPFFPMTVGYVSLICYNFLSPLISLSSVCLGVSWILNTALFERTAVSLYHLIKYFDHGMGNLAPIVIYLFCFNPASIFFSAFYSESIFAYCTTNMILSIYKKSFKQALLYATISTLARSNGLLNFGFVLGMICRDIFSSFQLPRIYPYGYDFHSIFEFIKKIFCIILACIPFLALQWFAKQRFCYDQEGYPTFIKLPPTDEKLQFCLSSLPYAYIQSKNWSVGFLQYFEVKQIPNFLLASPVLMISLIECWPRFRSTFVHLYLNWKPESFIELSLSTHGLFLTTFCLFCVHVQVTTRMIFSSCPYLYIFIAKRIRRELYFLQTRQIQWPSYTLFIQSWCLLYFTIGTLAFSLGFPWT